VAPQLYEAGRDGPMFRSGAVYVASAVGAAGTVDWLKDIATRPLRQLSADERQLCETDRDSEVLVRVMAVEGLGQIVDSAGREAVYDALTEVIAAQDDPRDQDCGGGRTRSSRPRRPLQIRDVLPSEHQHFADVAFKDARTKSTWEPYSLRTDPGKSQ
jgi:hypothetical protein